MSDHEQSHPNPSPKSPKEIEREQSEVLRQLLVEWILAIRSEYLASGANAMTHWDRLTSALNASARSCGTMDQWISKVRHRLQLTAPSRDSSRYSVALATEIADQRRSEAAVLRMIGERTTMLIARARVEADERKERKEAARAELAQPETPAGVEPGLTRMV